MIVPYADPAVDHDDRTASATDLARSWESCDILRRREHLLQLVPGNAI